jgi:hypothetical protein
MSLFLSWTPSEVMWSGRHWGSDPRRARKRTAGETEIG